MTTDGAYSLTELADLAGVTTRTVRYYLSQGLLPAVGQSGPGSKYDDRHLDRLRLIRRLQTEHLPLAEIRRRLDELDDDQIRGLTGTDLPAAPADSALDYLRSVLQPPVVAPRASAAAPLARLSVALSAAGPAPNVLAERLGDPRPSTPPTAPPAALATPIERSQWERIVLAPDVELHIRRPLTRAQNKQVDRLVTIARELLEEDRS
jgi:DNA-binding transcriptional MerR regulator